MLSEIIRFHCDYFTRTVHHFSLNYLIDTRFSAFTCTLTVVNRFSRIDFVMLIMVLTNNNYVDYMYWNILKYNTDVWCCNDWCIICRETRINHLPNHGRHPSLMSETRATVIGFQGVTRLCYELLLY
jgi:hypothetical protein